MPTAVRLAAPRLSVRLSAVASDRAVRAAAVATIATFALLQLLLAAWTHWAFEGRYDGPFLMKASFGVTAKEAAHGVRPVVHAAHQHNGWDGQFYYRASTDLFGRGPDVREHMEIVTYRYQRIGVPAVAAAASAVLGHPITSPFVYLLVQNLLAAVGVGAVAFFLARHGVSPWFASAWVGAGGTLYTLLYGLPDAAGDGVFAVAFVALWYRRLVVYTLGASLLVLIREGYVLFPFAVFVGTSVGRIRWERSRILAAVMTALPGVVVVGWAVYLSQHFGVPLTSKDRSPSDLYGWPTAAYRAALAEAVKWCDTSAVLHRVLAGVTIVGVGVLAARQAKTAAFACVLPYLALLTCTGPTVWWDQSGYFKLLGTVLMVGLFLLPFERGLVLRFLLAANLLVGLDWMFVRGTLPAPFYSPNGPTFENGPVPVHPFNASMNDTRRHQPAVPNAAANPPLAELKYDIDWTNRSDELAAGYQGVWRFAHRELVPVRVRVTNRGSVAWQPNPQLGHLSVNLAYYLTSRDGSRVHLDGRVPLPAAVGPGESVELTAWVKVGKPGGYVLHLAVVQDGVHWIDPANPGHPGVRAEVRVK